LQKPDEQRLWLPAQVRPYTLRHFRQESFSRIDQVAHEILSPASAV
jgi:hypothetical protein